MTPSPRQAYVRSRLRWYFGVLGLISLVPLLVTLTEPEMGAPSRVLAGLGLPVAGAYLMLGLGLPRWGSRRLVFGVLGVALVWLLAMAVVLGADGELGLMIPWALFLVVPCLNAWWWADEVLER
ncbi:MAG: hypothetical protein JNM72_21855 [Deltaproteobacteria bacterium]|nr:hypothetical protein [Deltaproteobacteria bacterium]